MKTYKFNRRDRRFTPWAALCVLSLVGAMVFAAPTVVFAQTNTYELSQDCDTAMVGNQHTITAKVTDESGAPVAGAVLMFQVQGNNPGFYPGKLTGPDGTFQFTYVGNNVGLDNIWLTSPQYPGLLATISTEWTAEDLCSSLQHVDVGGRVTLNAKKKGALKIAVCATDGLDVNNVNLESVYLAGVAPWHSKQKDSRLCPGGKNGVVDLVLKFKNRDVVEALGPDIEDGDRVDLVLTGELNDKTPIEGKWEAVIIKKKGKKHWKDEDYQDFGNSSNSNGNGKAKGHNK